MPDRETKVDLTGTVRDLEAHEAFPSLGQNRHDRRVLARMQKQAQKSSVAPTMATVRTLTSPEEIIGQEKDLSIFQDQLQLYETAQVQSRKLILLCNIYQQYGLQETARFIVLGVKEEDIQTGRVKLPSARIPPQVGSRLKATLNNTLGNKPVSLIAADEDDLLLRRVLVDSDIPAKEILSEGIRARQETIELMRMHIAWLQEHPQQTQVQESPTLAGHPLLVDQNPGVSLEPTPITPYSLSSWNLFWTTVPWSDQPQHLVPIPTTSRAEALETLDRVGRHDISVKPTSIMNLLESHLQKNALQRAMSARLKYVPEEIRAWAKLKRAGDRIPLLVPQERTAIFFVCGRDEYLQHLNHLLGR